MKDILKGLAEPFAISLILLVFSLMFAFTVKTKTRIVPTYICQEFQIDTVCAMQIVTNELHCNCSSCSNIIGNVVVTTNFLSIVYHSCNDVLPSSAAIEDGNECYVDGMLIR
jgi:hypothetical protein